MRRQLEALTLHHIAARGQHAVLHYALDFAGAESAADASATGVAHQRPKPNIRKKITAAVV